MAASADTEEKPERKKTPAKKKPAVKVLNFVDSGLADLLGAGLGIASGMVAAVVSINNSFFKNAEKYDVIEAERKIRDDKWKALKNRNISGHELIDGIQEIEMEYRGAVEKRLKSLGVSGTLQKWRTLRPHQQSEVAISVMAVTAVTLGALVSLKSSQHVANRQDELEQRLENQEAQR